MLNGPITCKNNVKNNQDFNSIKLYARMDGTLLLSK
jgi:hypothetical protein